MENLQEILQNHKQASNSSCSECVCNFCPLRGIHCEEFGCKSCEKDPDSGFKKSCGIRINTHRCQSCVRTYPQCGPSQVEFGDGFGSDNIIYCSGFIGA